MWRVTITELVTRKVLWTRDFESELRAKRYAKVAVRTNTEASVRRVPLVLLTPDI